MILDLGIDVSRREENSNEQEREQRDHTEFNVAPFLGESLYRRG